MKARLACFVLTGIALLAPARLDAQVPTQAHEYRQAAGLAAWAAQQPNYRAFQNYYAASARYHKCLADNLITSGAPARSCQAPVYPSDAQALASGCSSVGVPVAGVAPIAPARMPAPGPCSGGAAAGATPSSGYSAAPAGDPWTTALNEITNIFEARAAARQRERQAAVAQRQRADREIEVWQEVARRFNEIKADPDYMQFFGEHLSVWPSWEADGAIENLRGDDGPALVEFALEGSAEWLEEYRNIFELWYRWKAARAGTP